MTRKIPNDQFTSNMLYDLLCEQKKTNMLLQKLVDEIEDEGSFEKFGKVFDGRKKQK